MKIWKLVSGILSIVFFAVVLFQSCAVGVANTLGETGEAGGSGGIILSILMLAGGIVSIAVRNSLSNGGNIALVVIFALAAICGFALAGSFSDLKIWSAWCLINAALAIIAICIPKSVKENKIEEKK